MKKFERPSAEAIAAVQREAARALTREEFEAILCAPMSADEQDEKRALIRWFLRRYPTPAARLAHARHLARTWLDPAHPLGAPAPLREPR